MIWIQVLVDDAHIAALQLLSSDKYAPYQSTLKIVRAEGSRGPSQAPQVTRKHPVSRNTGKGNFLKSECYCIWHLFFFAGRDTSEMNLVDFSRPDRRGLDGMYCCSSNYGAKNWSFEQCSWSTWLRNDVRLVHTVNIPEHVVSFWNQIL